MSNTGSQSSYETTSNGIVATSASYLAASILGLVGAFQVLAAVTAIAEDDIYLAGPKYTFALDLTAWGWVHLLVGALAIGIAVGIFKGSAWALAAGIGIGFLSALSNFAFLPYYPLWAVVVIALDVVVLWALSQRLAHPG